METKRAETIKKAKAGVWFGVVFFIFGLVLLCDELFWHNEPKALHAFHLVTDCGVLLSGAFLRRDALQTLRRGAEKWHLSAGYVFGLVLLFLGQMGRYWVKYGAPPGFGLFLAASALLCAVLGLGLSWVLHRVSTRWKKEYKEHPDADKS